MSKLHELLAVESDLENTAKKILQETKKVFQEKGAFFIKQEKETNLFDESAKNPPVEKLEMTTTVADKLDYTENAVIKYFDAIAQKERTNQDAHADLEVDGKSIAKDVPATLLLGLESRLRLVRDVYETIPTLSPGGKWVKDSTLGDNVYRNENDETRFKTAKTIKSKVLVPPTFPKDGEGGQSQPAIIDKWDETENVGEITLRTWSGMLSSKEKSDILSRLDKLIRAVKKARQRANNTDVNSLKIGEAIFDYIRPV